MKRTFILLTITSLFIASCKKEVNNESESSMLNALAQKYHLSKIDTLVSNPTKSFRNAEDLEKFLSLRDSGAGPETYTVDLANSTKSNLEINDSGTVYPSGAEYSAMINCPGWGSSGFPNLIIFNWVYNPQNQVVSNISTQLIITGSNVGTYIYYPRTAIGYAVSTSGPTVSLHFNVTGLYVETFSVGGIYSYSKSYNYTFVGDSTYPNFTCTVNYVAGP